MILSDYQLLHFHYTVLNVFAFTHYTSVSYYCVTQSVPKVDNNRGTHLKCTLFNISKHSYVDIDWFWWSALVFKGFKKYLLII